MQQNSDNKSNKDIDDKVQENKKKKNNTKKPSSVGRSIKNTTSSKIEWKSFAFKQQNRSSLNG